MAAKASIYASQAVTAVMSAMRKLAPDATVSPSLSDLAYRVNDSLLLIEIKHRAAHRKLYLEDVRQIGQWIAATKASAALLISNVTPTSQATQFIEESGYNIQIVLWQPDFGAERIEKALSSLVSGSA